MGSQQQPAAAVTNPRSSRRRRLLSGVALALACLTILVTTVAVWTHQVAFNTNRFTALASRVITEPAVIDPLSARISAQVVDALGVEARIAARLPDAAKPLAGALTVAVRDAIDKRLQAVLSNPRIQQALTNTLSFTHAGIMRLLRGQSDALSIVDGYVQVHVFPIAGAALAELQAMGLIPPEVQLPDLSSAEAPEVLAQRLEAALGITLPDDFGTIQLMRAERLQTARSVVQAFDIIVVALVILSVVLVALAFWLARDRRRMVIYLAIGTIIAFLLARMLIRSVEDAALAGIADPDVALGIRAVVDATIEDLRGLTLIILVVTVIVAVAAYLWGRPKWVESVASQAGAAAGRAGGAAAVAGSAAMGAAAERQPTRATIEETVRTNRASVERTGLAVIAFIVAWIALGLEVALVGAALVVGFELLMRAIASPPEAEADAVAPGDGADTAGPPAGGQPNPGS